MAGTIEELVLQYGGRGMNVLYPFLPKDSFRKAAWDILALKRGCFVIATGFYRNGTAETDGPIGAWVLAHALSRLGFTPVFVTDRYAVDFFARENFKSICVPLNNSRHNGGIMPAETLLGRLNPVGMLAIERCGKNAEGAYANMRGDNIGYYTAPVDELFVYAKKCGITTYGIGDGGNEIGMGNLAEEIRRYLEISPCMTETDYLLLASVSNWAAYALVRMLELLAGKKLLPSPEAVRDYFYSIVRLGSVDGVTGENAMTVDGFPEGKEEEMYTKIMDYGQIQV